ncbi:MAG: hypothetical protein HYT80_06210 [Euryarchaeota archaeon]|nr:hypothetical protein [Euryarchaeota archaeon]
MDVPTVLIFIVSARVLVALVTGAAVEEDLLVMDPCEDILDYFTGCGGTVGAMVNAAIGGVPGAPATVNLLAALMTNIVLVWGVLALIRGFKG